MKEFLPDSYSEYKKDIMLVDDNNNSISKRDNVVLSFPYKDCILEMDSTEETEKRKEVFFNETLMKKEIDTLLSPKIFANVKRISKDGEEAAVDLQNDNLIIKGNNLLSMYSLVPRYKGIQDLHGKLNNITEYSISYEDFDDKKIVLIADEAHHINAATKKKLSAAEKEEDRNWEDTINNIFRANRDNVLLEFTATCDLKNPNILEKYCGNPAEIIFNYTLLEFRASGYTKDLFNLRTTLDPITRTIQAMLLTIRR